jgi:hypothetical protein
MWAALLAGPENNLGGAHNLKREGEAAALSALYSKAAPWPASLHCSLSERATVLVSDRPPWAWDRKMTLGRKPRHGRWPQSTTFEMWAGRSPLSVWEETSSWADSLRKGTCNGRGREEHHSSWLLPATMPRPCLRPWLQTAKDEGKAVAFPAQCQRPKLWIHKNLSPERTHMNEKCRQWLSGQASGGWLLFGEGTTHGH